MHNDTIDERSIFRILSVFLLIAVARTVASSDVVRAQNILQIIVSQDPTATKTIKSVSPCNLQKYRSMS
jgi:hypothetical protein